jgi:hypothetical protein
MLRPVHASLWCFTIWLALSTGGACAHVENQVAILGGE